MIRINDISKPLKSLKQCPIFIRFYTMPRDKRPGPIDWTGRTTGGRLLRVLRKRALPFPPNYLDSLHIFPPSLQSLLDEKNKIENTYRFIDIGYDYKPEKSLSKKRKSIKTNKIENDEIKSLDLLLVDHKTESEELNYEHIYSDWCHDEDGFNALINIANFYGIYRDLFRDPNYKFEDKVVPVKFTDYYPRPEKFLTKEIEQYFPGGVRLDYPEPRPIRMFKPLAPMLIEFNKYINDEEFDAYGVYRGNLIKPINTKYVPNVVIDASLLQKENKPNNKHLSNFLNEGITLIGDQNGKYTLGLFNLDSQYGDCEPICHWMLCNIHGNGSAKYDEAFSFIPPYGINGLGYSRFVFLLVKQKKEIHIDSVKDFDLTKRKIDILNFINSPETESKPVGLSWFQTFWDESCKHIFHNILDIREPTFEYIQPKATLTPQIKFPETAPFNVYLDHYRDPKEINKEVFLERMKKIHPFEYKRLMKPSKLPPNIHMFSWYLKVPSWYRSTMWKRSNKLGPYRLLRNASKILPSENNLDLDYPIWPHTSKLNAALRNPIKGHPIPYREGKWALPPNKHPSIRIHDEDIKSLRRKEIEEDNKLLEEMEENLKNSKN